MTRVDVCEFLAGRVADPETGWSLGTFGAIAEFTRDGGEPADVSNAGPSLQAVTPRGGLRIDPSAHMRLIASEGTTRESWNQRIALCLPTERCAMSRRSVLSELGPDAGALRAEDRDAILFDLGLDALQADLCVRVADPAVAAKLRALAGRSVFEPGNPAMGIILAINPHRVFISRLGRIEVFQPIPPPDGTSPEGPHTHVLPKLLRHRRTHTATEPVPDGWVPCAHLYPPHAIKDDQGRARPFDAGRHDAFQDMLRLFGDEDLFAFKQRIVAAVSNGEAPESVSLAGMRFARTCVRVALRQLKASGTAPSLLPAWVSLHERRADPEEGEEEDIH